MMSAGRGRRAGSQAGLESVEGPVLTAGEWATAGSTKGRARERVLQTQTQREPHWTSALPCAAQGSALLHGFCSIADFYTRLVSVAPRCWNQGRDNLPGN